MLYLGLMSGTSMDGVDAALCEFDDTRFTGVRAKHSVPYPGALRAELLKLQRSQPSIAIARFAALDHDVAQSFAAAAQGLLGEAKLAPDAIAAIGSHGQTVFHDPAGARSSLQLGDPSLIAARTGVTTVADFRRADIARGGHGAPLVPAFHHAVFARRGVARAVVNVGGIANVTLLPDDDPDHVQGFDVGPGNALMDEWAQAHRDAPMDRDGMWAASGRVAEPLLAALLADPYFDAAPPKSTGRDRFNLEWARHRFAGLDGLPAADVQRTFCELTARTIVDAIHRHAGSAVEVYVCGGGALNSFLMDRLRALAKGLTVADTRALELAPDVVECAAFAWLAMRTLKGLPGNVPGVTGASGAAVLGGIYRA